MKSILVVDASCLINFSKFYYFDRDNETEVYDKLNDFLISKVKSGEIVIVDKVFSEFRDNKFNGELKKEIKPYVIQTLPFVKRVGVLIEENVRQDIISLRGYDPQQVEQYCRAYEEEYADLYLVAYCKHLKEQKIKSILITEESFREDGKIIEKIPTICKKEKIEYRNIPYSLFEIYKDELKFTLNVTLIKKE